MLRVAAFLAALLAPSVALAADGEASPLGYVGTGLVAALVATAGGVAELVRRRRKHDREVARLDARLAALERGAEATGQHRAIPPARAPLPSTRDLGDAARAAALEAELSEQRRRADEAKDGQIADLRELVRPIVEALSAYREAEARRGAATERQTAALAALTRQIADLAALIRAQQGAAAADAEGGPIRVLGVQP